MQPMHPPKIHERRKAEDMDLGCGCAGGHSGRGFVWVIGDEARRKRKRKGVGL